MLKEKGLLFSVTNINIKQMDFILLNQKPAEKRAFDNN